MPLLNAERGVGSTTSICIDEGGHRNAAAQRGDVKFASFEGSGKRNIISVHVDEPVGLKDGLSSKRKEQGSKKRGRQVENESCVTDDPCASSNSFKVPLTDEEERRRFDRQMRFLSTDEPRDTTISAVLSALSTPRDGRPIANTKKRDKRRSFERGSTVDNIFVGISQALEKPYLRLTTFPKPEEVRPLPVLQRAFDYIKTKYRETEDFSWANEQLKSLRQDLTVQGLKNDFTLEVYEVHARLALEEGDLNEFNQCQTMIKSLTLGMTKASEDIDRMEFQSTQRGAVRLLKQRNDAADEFAAYRLLYATVQREPGEVNKELVIASYMMSKEHKRAAAEKDRDARMSSCEHAILVTKAIVACDYHTFFVLYQNAPNMSGYLMDFLVQRVRASAFKRIISAYRPTLSVEFFRESLSFRDLEETRIFLKKNGAVFVRDPGGCGPLFWVDCKASRP